MTLVNNNNNMHCNINNININEKTIYYYTMKNNETNFYEIKEYPSKTLNRFRTSVPINNTDYQYVNYFDNYSKAFEHVYKHQTDYLV